MIARSNRAPARVGPCPVPRRGLPEESGEKIDDSHEVSSPLGVTACGGRAAYRCGLVTPATTPRPEVGSRTSFFSRVEGRAAAMSRTGRNG
ncbi:hypothetical protein A7982_13996 [Minicystis rosea]|nr:hypothetical protein A7982_13996 [Minicystis rosea]